MDAIKRPATPRKTNSRELLNVMAVVYDEDPDKPYVPHFFPFTQIDLDSYYPQVLSPKQIPGIAYTYGQRLRNHDGVDQIANIIELIKTRPFSKNDRRHSRVAEDWNQVNKGDTPCLTQVIFSIQDGKLFATTHFRSQDMVHGWLRNVFSLPEDAKNDCRGNRLPHGGIRHDYP